MAYQVFNQLQQTYSQKSAEVLDWTYYDTEVISASVLNPVLFQVPISSGKTPDLTNMRLAGQIPMGQHLTVHAIRVMYTASTLYATSVPMQKMLALMAQTTVEIKIGNKDSSLFVTAQELFGNCMGVVLESLTETVNKAGSSPILGGVAKYHGIYPLASRIPLEPTATFAINVVHSVAPDPSLAGDWFKIGLSGKLVKTK